MAKTYQKLLTDILYSEDLQTCSRETQGLMLQLIRYLSTSKKYTKIITGGGEGCDMTNIVYNVLGTGVQTGKSIDELTGAGIIPRPPGIQIVAINEYMITVMSEMLSKSNSVFKDRLVSSLTNKEVSEHKEQDYYQALYIIKEIYDAVYKWMPGDKVLAKAKIEVWLNTVLLTISRDNRTPKEIYDLFVYAHNDIGFWKKTIRSPGSLREHYDKIFAQKQLDKEQQKDAERENPEYLPEEER